MYCKRVSGIALSCLLGFVAGSCSDADPAARIKPSENGQIDPAKATSWNGGIGELFVQKCGNCHPGVRPSNYRTYAGVNGNLSSGSQSVQARINDNSMPPGGLGEELKTTVNDWIKAGAPESDSSGNAPAR